jgi:hypothetical protein
MSAYSLEPITVTAATLTLDYDLHNNAVVVIDRAAGCAVTLPASTGMGAHFTVVVGTTVSTNSITISAANATDTFFGVGVTGIAAGGAGFQEGVTGTDDRITMAGTVNGGIAGSVVELTDVKATKWLVNARLIGSGTLESGWSAAVS